MPELESNHCNGEASGNCGDGDSGGGGYWLQLDRDLVETISSIYPDWFAPTTKDTINNNSPTTTNNNTTCKASLPAKSVTSSKAKSTSKSKANNSSNPKPSSGTKRSISISNSIDSKIKVEPSDIIVKSEPIDAVEDTKATLATEYIANSINKLGFNKVNGTATTLTVTMAEGTRNGNIGGLTGTPSVGIVLGVGTNGFTTAGSLTGGLIVRESPPKAIVDTSPLLNSLEQNKESLKVKLLLRRPVEQLVAQGIMPPLKTPAAFHGQRRQLERAKTGDLLKSKIQQRPSRHELESRHILEADPKHVDPSLAEKQRMLKKAKLADQLNDQLSHRPGPLELIEKNILHTEEPIEQAVKTGRIPYRATCEGNLNRPQHPLSYITPEEDSQSSEDNIVSPGPLSDVLEAAAKSAGIVVSLIPASEGTVVLTTAASPFSKDSCTGDIVFADLCHQTITSASSILSQQQVSSPVSLVSTSTLSPLSSVSSPIPCQISSQPSTPAPPPMPITLTAIPTRPATIQSPIITLRTDAPGKDKNRKKCKSKNAPKTRTIKFHEYKGPPSAHKSSALQINTNGETSYDLLLQQQTLLLQFQLQLQHKYPQIILPANQKIQTATIPVETVQTITNNNNNISVNNANSNSNANVSSVSNSMPSPAPSTASESSIVAPSTPMRITGRLEDMKVSDLKAELKRRSLPVSGSKPQLIERLKPFTDQAIVSSTMNDMPMSNASTVDESHNSPQLSQSDIGSPAATQLNSIDESSDQMELGEPPSPSPQQVLTIRKESLTQEDIVREQQLKIEKLQRELLLSQLKLQAAQRAEPKKIQVCQQQLQQLQQLQQARQPQSNEEQQRIQQQQHIAFQNQKNLNGGNGIILNGLDGTLLLNHFIQGNAKIINGFEVKPQAMMTTTTITPNIDVKQEYISIGEVKPPPIYEEATKFNNIKKEPRKHIKSQTVEDVLEILIKNGELPPSAAQDPITPVSADTKSIEPVYPQVADNTLPEVTLAIDENEILNNLDMDNVDFSQFAMELGLQAMDNNQLQDGNTNSTTNMIVPMDTDEWLDSFLPSTIDDNHIPMEQNANTILPHSHHQSLVDCADLGSYDPLLGIVQEPFDPFGLEEYRNLTWDKVDFAA